jgi:hypothetical protein
MYRRSWPSGDPRRYVRVALLSCTADCKYPGESEVAATMRRFHRLRGRLVIGAGCIPDWHAMRITTGPGCREK